jgi:predicted phosphodiesterase
MELQQSSNRKNTKKKENKKKERKRDHAGHQQQEIENTWLICIKGNCDFYDQATDPRNYVNITVTHASLPLHEQL